MKALIPSELSKGDRIRILKPVPLMPEIDPVDVFAAIQKAKKIDGLVDIIETHQLRSVVWLKIAAFDSNTSASVTGWVNTIALLGPEKYELCPSPTAH
jgi:hypothetical protein